MVAVNDCPALVLNADFRPLSYFPLSLWSWQEAVKAVFLERVNIVSEYEQVVRSPGFAMRRSRRGWSSQARASSRGLTKLDFGAQARAI